METKNHVFIATSIDGYIADKNGSIEFLQTIPNPENLDFGYNAFIKKMDAIVMGRGTFETVLEFGISWPYQIPVFVVSSRIQDVSDDLARKVEIVNGSPTEITQMMTERGFTNIYIDGGITIQRYLQEDIIDEMIISTIPVILGGGTSLFGELTDLLEFEWISSEIFLNAITQVKYRRKR
ncbi:dihydrofolate reductase family protein [Draconibacterium sp. IB214405]|uniref:dihydrofolate reductase family protein n=1 Tax=Draconibacterium sp. IB214405 TaxID=3097352 RepID=UPI002A0DEBA6|nr:dihydrofolate reductase family protein [Draconibacterium sp. IB214405]MDX8339543.1 dihydrofolate reductase family protein [Draconibacterium sp. IB214405]